VTYRDSFADFGGHVWLNCAHQGPLPNVARQALERAAGWKQRPFELTSERFREVPARLRAAIGSLINAPAHDIILANSASYGLHLVAKGLPLDSGDQVIVFGRDFPSDVLPWLLREREGVVVTRITPHGAIVELEDITEHVRPTTRALCLTWVHSFTGWAIDLAAIGQFCRRRGITFVVNASQAIGARPIDVATAPVDVVVGVGFKWLCGPYGTGFCWISPELRERLPPTKAYWLSMFTADDLAAPLEVTIKPGSDARRFDVFGTANFFNYVPWTASVEFLLEQGVDRIRDYDQALVERLVRGLRDLDCQLVSPPSGPRRSTLVVFAARVPERTSAIYDALSRANIHVALRSGNIRMAPHLYNTEEDIDEALAVIRKAS
jgi:cysteine desulfurase/selenocysteine lyase